MGKTYREIEETNDMSRSISWNSKHDPYSKGGRKKMDRSAHATHRNQNRCIKDETEYIDFTHAKKKRRNVAKYKKWNHEDSIPLNKIIENNGWINASLKDNLITYIQIKNDTVLEHQGDKFWRDCDVKYLNQCLKKVKRRGNINQFIGHNIESQFTI
jgi:hypothetical protein